MRVGRQMEALVNGRARKQLGVAATEMAVIILLIAVVAFGAVRLFGGGVADLWDQGASGMQTARSPSEDSDGGGGGNPGNSGGGGNANFPTTTTVEETIP